MGGYLARLHQTTIEGLGWKSKKHSRNQKISIKGFLESTRIPLLNESNREQGIKMLEILNNLPSFEKLDEVVINADLHSDNLIVTKHNNSVSIDWDFAGIGTATRDIADFLLNNIQDFESGKDFSEAFFKGYTKFRKLTGQEKNLLLNEMKLYLIEYGMEHEKDTVNQEYYKRLLQIDSEFESIRI